jgi:hypothetical protein
VEIAEPVTGMYPDEPRLPLLTLSEAREVVALLQQLAGGEVADRAAAGDLAGTIGRRLPAD